MSSNPDQVLPVLASLSSESVVPVVGTVRPDIVLTATRAALPQLSQASRAMNLSIETAPQMPVRAASLNDTRLLSLQQPGQLRDYLDHGLKQLLTRVL